jgi:hypothetical protein
MTTGARKRRFQVASDMVSESMEGCGSAPHVPIEPRHELALVGVRDP